MPHESPSRLTRPAPSVRGTPWHFEGLTAKAYRVTRGIQLIENSPAEPAVESNGKEILRRTYQGQIDSMTNRGASAKSYGHALSLALETAAKSFAAELRRDLRATH